jgi:hypothetical protein
MALKRVWLGSVGPYLYDDEKTYKGEELNFFGLRAEGDTMIDGDQTVGGDVTVIGDQDTGGRSSTGGLVVDGRTVDENSILGTRSSPTVQDYQLFMAVHLQAGVF